MSVRFLGRRVCLGLAVVGRLKRRRGWSWAWLKAWNSAWPRMAGFNPASGSFSAKQPAWPADSKKQRRTPGNTCQ